ncbi:hypothetical protein Q5752_006940 [Cryptotrichosporon argae]
MSIPYPQPRPAMDRQASLAPSALSLPGSPSPAHSNITLPTIAADSPPPSPPASTSSAARFASSVSSSSADASVDEATPLLPAREAWYAGPVAVAAVQLALLFVVFAAVLVGTFYWGLPRLDDADRGAVRLPRSFADVQALNALFQKYKHMYPLRMMACGVVAYLFVQTFSLPGSMYVSILFGAAYGLAIGLVLSCLCDSLGSLLCYTLSSLLAPPLLTLPTYRARLEVWRAKLLGPSSPSPGAGAGGRTSRDSLFAFLVVLRIAPFPPHWVTNVLAPHLGIAPLLFFLSSAVGIAPVSVIHVTIGRGLDDMTSAADLHVLSVRNVLALAAVAVAVLVPVGLKRVFRKDLGELGDIERAAKARVEPADADADVDAEQAAPIDDDNASVRATDAAYAQPTFRAVDSGLRLARPSTGIDGAHEPGRKPKRLGTILEHPPAVHAEPGRPAGKRGAVSVGYGAIEPAPPNALPAPVQAKRGGAWWRTTRA